MRRTAEDIFHLLDVSKLDGIGLSSLHERAVLLAVELFLKFGSVPMLWLVGCSRTGDVHLVQTDTASEHEKIAMLAAMRGAMRAIRCDVFSQISEVWVADVTAETPAEWRDLPPNQREDRRDALAVFSRDKAGAQKLTRFIVTYQPKGPPLLGQRDDVHEQGGRFDGCITALLED